MKYNFCAGPLKTLVPVDRVDCTYIRGTVHTKGDRQIGTLERVVWTDPQKEETTKIIIIGKYDSKLTRNGDAVFMNASRHFLFAAFDPKTPTRICRLLAISGCYKQQAKAVGFHIKMTVNIH